MDDSETSSLSSAPPSGDEKLAPIFLNVKGKAKGKRVPISLPVSPPRRKRTPSPEREMTLADNPDIAFIVMFRNRFSEAFPPKLAQFGPQDIERGVADTHPTAQVEDILCALLGILLNRKKPVERGHHGRALEEAISTQKGQWPRCWNGINPLSGNKSFTTMSPVERLILLRQLILWSLTTSDVVSNLIRESYKQTRHDDDVNQPLSIQAWGKDEDKRAYFLIEGQDDTSFRLYRETPRTSGSPNWMNVAGSIEEITAVANKLEKESSISGRQLARSIIRAIPRFEATEEKRKRREYRQTQRSRFSRPDPGFSLYEGRTRGKRMRYTFDDDDGEGSDDAVGRLSTRLSGRSTPLENKGPTVTASGRQVKARGGGLYGETLLSGQNGGSSVIDDTDMLDQDRTRRSSRSTALDDLAHLDRKRHADSDEESSQADAESDHGWNSADNAEHGESDGDEEMQEDDLGSDEELGDTILPQKPTSRLVKLKVGASIPRPQAPQDVQTAATNVTLGAGPIEMKSANDSAQPATSQHTENIAAQPVNGHTAPLQSLGSISHQTGEAELRPGLRLNEPIDKASTYPREAQGLGPADRPGIGPVRNDDMHDLPDKMTNMPAGVPVATVGAR